ncbi:MAG: GNAT family N-acetyltransferase [Victivallales bacterium]|nr:GNAT family N-acetyltransferase [Victivallales bacterium]
MIVKADYKKLSKTNKGLDAWNNYMSQITQIALQYPNHFLEELAYKAIPNDAANHHCYLSLCSEGNVIAFCVLSKTFLEAELLWLAVDKKHSRKGIGRSLVRKIESDIRNEDPSIIQIVGKATAPDSELTGTEIGGEVWKDTNSFHKSLGYEFQYKLEDYWHTGNHVAFFAKRYWEDRVGYERLDIEPEINACTGRTSYDKYPEINQSIQKYIRGYLRDFFLEITEIKDPIETVTNLSSLRKGFVGIAFIPHRSHRATVFADGTEKNYDIQIDNYEYEVNRSALTQILTNNQLPDAGVILYKNSYDANSQIKIHDYFLKTPGLESSQEGYSLFYHRSRKKESMVCFYFISHAKRNVIVEKRNWREFCKTSPTILFGLYNLLWGISRESHLSNDAYLRSLLSCVRVPEKLKRSNSYLRILFSMTKSLEKEVEKLKAVADLSYFTAHPLKTRIRQLATGARHLFYDILDVKDEKKSFAELQQVAKEHLYRVERNFQFAGLSHMLHSSAVQGHDLTLSTKDNKGTLRFASDSAIDDLFSFIENIFQEIMHFNNSEISLEFPADWTMQLTGYHYKDGQCLRPNDEFYKEIFTEILSNAAEYSCADDSSKIKVKVNIENEIIDNRKIPLVSFSNYAMASDPQSSPFLKKPKDTWFKWSLHNPTGLSFVARCLKMLHAGALYCRHSNGSPGTKDMKLFSVGLSLHGLNIIEKGKENR